MKKTPKTEEALTRRTITFDPPDDVRRMLEKAQQATGADRSELIVEALRTDLEKVVRRIIEQRRQAEAEFFRLAKESQISAGAEKAASSEPLTNDNPAQTKRKAAS